MERSTTADTILDAAAKVFADKGFEGARVEELARAAGVNKATLYYQVGDKERLYHAVVEQILGRCVREISEAQLEFGSGRERVSHFIQTMAKNTAMMEYAAPILLREVASGGRHLSDTALGYMGQLLGTLDETLAEGVKSGEFRQTNAFFVHMMIVGSLSLYAANEPIRKRNVENRPEIFRADHFLTAEQAAATVTDLVLAAIAPQQTAQKDL